MLCSARAEPFEVQAGEQADALEPDERRRVVADRGRVVGAGHESARLTGGATAVLRPAVHVGVGRAGDEQGQSEGGESSGGLGHAGSPGDEAVLERCGGGQSIGSVRPDC